ncbi:MAG: hypothetical protein R2838_09020 [Caldilineaceae bacterium]
MSDEQAAGLQRTQQGHGHVAAISLVGWIRIWTKARTTPGAEGWSVKDHVAHLDVWLRRMVALLRHEGRVAAMGVGAADFESATSSA